MRQIVDEAIFFSKICKKAELAIVNYNWGIVKMVTIRITEIILSLRTILLRAPY